MRYSQEPGFAETYIGQGGPVRVSLIYINMTDTSTIEGPPARKRSRYLFSVFFLPVL